MSTVHLNSAGDAHLNSLVDANKVDHGPWEWSESDRSKTDSNMFLGVDTSVPGTDAAHYKYPFGKGGTVNRKALASIEGYATTNGENDIAAAAKKAAARIDADKSKHSDRFGAITIDDEASKVPNPESVGTLRGVEIFRVGEWRGSKTVTATPKMLAQIVDNFHSINQVEGYGVPVKIGHTAGVGAPAFGWMSSLSSDGEVLTADFADVPSTIIDAIGKRRYNSVSVELYPSLNHAGKSFNNVLGAVALLGAEWPAVKGLKSLSSSKFSELAVERIELTQNKEPVVANEATTFTQEQHDAVVATRVAAVEAASVVKITAAEQRAVIAETALKTFRDEADKKAVEAVITAAEKSGKIVPANKEKFVKFAASVLKATDPAERAELFATFSELLAAAPAKVTFGELGASKSDDSAAQGQKASDLVAEKAKAFMAEDKTGKLDFAAAVKAVLASDADLRHAYAQGV